MNNNNKTLINYLEQEIHWIEELNSVLAEEKNVLLARQFDQLDTLAEKKQLLSAQLEESAQQKIKLMQMANHSSNISLKEYLSQCDSEEAEQINQLNARLAQQLTRCRELNIVNGQVIANNMYVRQQIVNALSGNKADAVSVYTAHGNISSSTTTHRHHEEA